MNQSVAGPGALNSARAGPAMRGHRRSHPVLRLLAGRLLVSFPLLVVVSAMVFVLTSLTPGDVTRAILGPGLPPQEYAAWRQFLGLDKPLYDQYWIWLSHALSGNLGQSLITRVPVTTIISQHFSVTLSLVVGTLVVSVVVGVALGIMSAVVGGVPGRAVDAIALTGWVVPVYWLAAVMTVVFAVKLRWLPAIGYVPFSQSPGEWLRSLVLPVCALSVGAVAWFAKYTREGMLDALASEYVRMARANGVPERSVVFQHAFKSASVQVLTLMGLLTVGLLGGTVFVENVFDLPGLGSQIVQSVTQGDIPVVQGIAVFFTIIVVAVNLLVDLSYAWVSPKVRVK